MYKFRDYVVSQIYKPYTFHSWGRSLRSHDLLPPGTVNQRHLAPHLSLECTSCPLVPCWEPCLRIHPWQSMCFGDHLNRIDDLTPLRPLYELLRFWNQVPRVTHLAMNAQDKPRQVCEFSCILPLPPEHLWSSASSLSLSLPSYIYGFPSDSAVKNPSASTGDTDLIPG